MTRNGKIARLPREVREQLNRRLQDGEPGTKLVDWLNSLPDAQAVLAAEFESRAISEQNLSEWKAGGYRDWLAQQEALDMIGRLTANTAELKQASPELLTDQLAIFRTMGDPSSRFSIRKSEKSEGASAATRVRSAAARVRISTSPTIPPRTVRRCLRARALADINTTVSVALGSTLRAADRISRRRSLPPPCRLT